MDTDVAALHRRACAARSATASRATSSARTHKLRGTTPTGRAKDALRVPGALEGRVHTSMGRIPAREYAMQLFGDVVVHGWDLARAVGADEQLDPHLVEAAYDFYKPQELILRVSGLFGRQVDTPADADTQTKLLGLLGRRA